MYKISKEIFITNENDKNNRITKTLTKQNIKLKSNSKYLKI